MALKWMPHFTLEPRHCCIHDHCIVSSALTQPFFLEVESIELGKLEVDHMKTVDIDTNDRDKGMVVDAQPEIVHGGVRLKHRSDDVVKKTHLTEGL